MGEPHQGNAYPAGWGAVSDGIPALELAAPGDLAGAGSDLALGDVDGMRGSDDTMERLIDFEQKKDPSGGNRMGSSK